MKKEYVKPSMEIEVFTNSEYIAACTISKDNATLYAVCENRAFGEHWGDKITELQTGLGGIPWGNVHYKVNGVETVVFEPITGIGGTAYSFKWDKDNNGVISEGDYIEWRSDCYGAVKSTQNHS